jgi:hypothetical protein
MNIYRFEIITAGIGQLLMAFKMCSVIKTSAKVRNTGIAKRGPVYMLSKMEEGKAIIAVT